MTARRSITLPLVLLGASLVAAAGFVVAFPAVEGLGTKVKLPVFHGALTWVNLAVFTTLGIAALVYVFSRNERVYPWEEALRWVGISIWATGSVLGFTAAMQTWDFTGASSASRWEIVGADPRLMAQFWIMLGGLALIAVGLLIEDRLWLAAGDVIFVVLTWMVLLRAVLGPGRALHPDSPVLNSDEILIKALFFGIVIALGLAVFSVTWVVRTIRGKAASQESDPTLPQPVSDAA